MRQLRVFLTAAAVFVIAATMATAQDRPRIVAVNYALASLAERLVDDAAEVVFPVPESVDPSFWRPSISDISAIQSADLILLNGAGFATWIDRVSLPRSKLINTSAAFTDRFIATETITHSHGDGGEHSHEGVASYTWLDPELAMLHAEAIAAALAGRGLDDPGAVYARLEDLRGDLDALQAEASAALAPLADTTLIATHPRYQYLARAYGLEIVALEWEAGAAPTDDELTELNALMADHTARILIWEATPPAYALDDVSALGLTSVTFAPLAQVAEGDFITAYRTAVADLAAAASTLGN